jgi:signal transduction histidine kinase
MTSAALRRSSVGCGVAVVGVLAVWTAWIETGAQPAGHDGPVLVTAVGVAFPAAALVGRGPRAMRLLLAAVGVAWLVASVLPTLVLVHQALLAVALLAFPTGRPRGPVRWTLTAAAVPVALVLVPQAGVAVLFGGVALAALHEALRRPRVAAYPLTAGAAVGLLLGASWLVSRLAPAAFDPTSALIGYELLLVLVAAGFVPASRVVAAEETRVADRLVREAGEGGLGVLTGVLADVLQDPTLRVLGPGEGEDDECGADPDGRHPRRLEIWEDGRRLAVVLHRSSALADAPTRAGVESAVRLMARQLERQRELDRSLVELRAARARLVAAADRQRVATALDLRAGVLGLLESAGEVLGRAGPQLPDAVARDAVRVAASEVEAAVRDIDRIVRGVAPQDLGGGALVEAVRRLAAGSAVPVGVQVQGDVAGGAGAESALFYACSEALANAGKHSGGAHVSVLLEGGGNELVLTVTDDGPGGADPSGSGLQGLGDRLATAGGRLCVESPRGAGTWVTATVPR